MVNNNNQNNWVPKEWKPNIPKTATVSYYYPKEEINHIPLIQNGVYQSQKTLINEPSYGPSLWDNLSYSTQERLKEIGKEVASVALAVNYVTPIAPITIVGTVAAGIGAAVVLNTDCGSDKARAIAEDIVNISAGGVGYHYDGTGKAVVQGAAVVRNEFN